MRVFGDSWEIQFEVVDLSLPVDTNFSWTARVAFALNPGLVMPFQGVLGTDGFLDKFAVTFNKYYDYFVVERSDDFHERAGRQLTSDPTQQADEHWRHAHGA